MSGVKGTWLLKKLSGVKIVPGVKVVWCKMCLVKKVPGVKVVWCKRYLV